MAWDRYVYILLVHAYMLLSIATEALNGDEPHFHGRNARQSKYFVGKNIRTKKTPTNKNASDLLRSIFFLRGHFHLDKKLSCAAASSVCISNGLKLMSFLMNS